ncbi:hypothetical protein U1Q18_014022 [Sarracenia purpurea var. burkii]
MKRELAFVLETRSQFTGALGRTRASKIRSRNGDLNGLSAVRRSKRFKGIELESNGRIDWSQGKSEINSSIGQNQEKVVSGSPCNGISVYRRTRRVKNASSEVEEMVGVVETLETVIQDKTKCNLVTPTCEVKNNDGLSEASTQEDGSVKSTANEGGSKVLPMAVDESNDVRNEENNEVINNVDSEVKRNLLVETPRRFTRSSFNSKSEVELMQCSVSVAAGSGVLDSGRNQLVLNAEVNKSLVVLALETQTQKLELKMSKKRGLRTIKELFSTGLLEGYSVFYNGGNKGSKLRGTIKDVGILCFCSLCSGSTVVTPTKFEIHACNSYRNAAKYICLENGKSLQQVVKVCRNSPLNMLEATIQSVVGPLPKRESIICQNCKEENRLCPSCMGFKDSEASWPTPVHTVDTKARFLKLLPAFRRATRSATAAVSSQNRNQERMMEDRSLKPALASKYGSYSVPTLTRKKSQGKIAQSSSVSSLVSKSAATDSVCISSSNNSQGKITKKSSKTVLIPSSSRSTSQCISPQKKSKWKITKKDLRMHKLVFEDGGLPDGTEVAYYNHGQKLLEGYKRGLGIVCRCCNSEISPSQFEVHAGWASRRKPYGYIYTSNGVSLHEFAISLLKGRTHPTRENDDLCTICADGGNLLLCDGCPRAFHTECASLSSIPRGKWFCKYCHNMFQREKFVEHNANALAAGRVSGVDPIEEITKRCIRIVKNPDDAEVIACVLCRGYNFRKSGFGPFTVIVCDQCEKEYHVCCLKKQKMADLKELPKGKWFCCINCRRIYSALQNLLIRGEEKIPDSLLDVIKRKCEDKVSDSLDVRWRVLSGKITSSETRLLLSKSVAIFHVSAGFAVL